MTEPKKQRAIDAEWLARTMQKHVGKLKRVGYARGVMRVEEEVGLHLVGQITPQVEKLKMATFVIYDHTGDRFEVRVRPMDTMEF